MGLSNKKEITNEEKKFLENRKRKEEKFLAEAMALAYCLPKKQSRKGFRTPSSKVKQKKRRKAFGLKKH